MSKFVNFVVYNRSDKSTKTIEDPDQLTIHNKPNSLAISDRDYRDLIDYRDVCRAMGKMIDVVFVV